jgi:hypothetical protein
VWAVKYISSFVSANRAAASGSMEGSVIVSAVSGREREKVRERRNFNLADWDTLENTHLSKVGERRESI